MTGEAPERLAFYRPAEVASRLGCSEWWVKEQARQRRIPFCWIGGSYRFTERHVAEIARLCEVRPADHTTGQSGTPRAVGRPPTVLPESGTVLRARRPRRAREVAARTDAA